MVNKKPKDPKGVKEGNKKRILKGKSMSVVFAALALTITLVAFGGLLLLQRHFSDQVVYKDVVVAKEEVPAGEIVTMENAAKYFEIKPVDTMMVPDGALSNLDSVLGEKALVAVRAKEIATEKDFGLVSYDAESCENPVEVTVSVTDVAAADGGRLRKGDRVNLSVCFSREQLGMTAELRMDSLSYVPKGGEEEVFLDVEAEPAEDELLDEEAAEEEQGAEDPIADEDGFEPAEGDESGPEESSEGEANTYVFEGYSNYVIENLCVVKAYDSAGLEIAPSDKDSIATMFTFVIDKSDELALSDAIIQGSDIRVSRIVE